MKHLFIVLWILIIATIGWLLVFAVTDFIKIRQGCEPTTLVIGSGQKIYDCGVSYDK